MIPSGGIIRNPGSRLRRFSYEQIPLCNGVFSATSLPAGTTPARLLGNAITSLGQATNPRFWTGNDSLARNGGSAVFTQTANAIRVLNQIGRSGTDSTLFQGAVNAIVQTDRLLSKAARNPNRLDAQQKELSNGDKSAANQLHRRHRSLSARLEPGGEL